MSTEQLNPPATMTEPDQLEVKQKQIEALTARVDFLQTVQAEYDHDIEIINDRILEEADDRGWCDEFDSIIKDVNGQLTRVELRTRSREYTVQYIVSVTATGTTDFRDEIYPSQIASAVEDVFTYAEYEDVTVSVR